MNKYIFSCVALKVERELSGTNVQPDVLTYIVEATSTRQAKEIGELFCEAKFPRFDGYARPLTTHAELLEDFLAKPPITKADIS